MINQRSEQLRGRYKADLKLPRRSNAIRREKVLALKGWRLTPKVCDKNRPAGPPFRGNGVACPLMQLAHIRESQWTRAAFYLDDCVPSRWISKASILPAFLGRINHHCPK